MAKDPAVLWYWNDWQGGTMTLSRHQKGCYMDLLAAQFNIGPLSLDQIKTVLGQDQAVWTVLQGKFKREVNSDSIEVFFNERLATEKKRRGKFIEKQSENGRKGGRKPKNNPRVSFGLTNIENENEIENKVDSKVLGLVVYNAETEILGNQIEFEKICMVTGKNFEQGKELLRNYHLYLEEKEQYPKGKRAVYAGFEKWIRNEKKFNGTHQQTPGGKEKLGTSEARERAARNY